MPLNPRIIVREACEEDAENIAKINIICWKTAYRGIIEDSFLDNLTLTQNRIERFKDGIRQKQIYLCAIQDNKIVGYLNGGKTKEKSLPYPYEVYCFYIHPDYQGKGIGTYLLQEFNQKINAAPFCVYMLDGNKKALEFYQKNGGKRRPEFDTDTVVFKLKTHNLLLSFNEKEG